MYLLKMQRMKMGIIQFEMKGEEIRVFSDKEKAEEWLMHNGFIHGQRSYFQYPENDKEWFHQKEKMQDRIDVVLEEVEVDDFSNQGLLMGFLSENRAAGWEKENSLI